MASKDCFAFRFEWRDYCDGLSDADRCKVYEAAIEYAAERTLPDLRPKAMVAFMLISRDIDRDSLRHESISEARREAGRKGMRKRWGKDSNCYDNKNSNCYNGVRERLQTTDKECIADDNKNNNCYKTEKTLQKPITIAIKDSLARANNNPAHAVILNQQDNINPIEIKENTPLNKFKGVKEKKELPLRDPEKREAEADTPYPPSKRYTGFLGFVKEKAPYCYGHMKLPTEVEFYKMVDRFGSEMVAEIVEQIENRIDLRKTYSNMYRTMLNWLKNEEKRRNGTL